MEMRPGGREALMPALWSIIRRIFRNASMMGLLYPPKWFGTPPRLESVKKTHQVARVGMGPHPSRRCRLGQRYLPNFGQARVWLMSRVPQFNGDPTAILARLGFVTDHGPSNEAPGDADCGPAWTGADRPDRDLLVHQPRRPAAGGRGANPHRDRPRPGGQRQYRCFGFSRKLRLVS